VQKGAISGEKPESGASGWGCVLGWEEGLLTEEWTKTSSLLHVRVHFVLLSSTVQVAFHYTVVMAWSSFIT
jgi:hypothetical protein